jgi:phage terminase large subunit GpA-like protein
MTDDTHALSDVCRAWPALLPPNRVPVSQSIAENLVIKRPGGAGGRYDPLETAYMVEPADMLASRSHSAVCFVGPAQSGKTVSLVDGWVAHAVINDPGDMLVVQMTQDKAREFSKQRIDRAILNSPKLRAMRSVMARDDNLHDKQFRNGMWLRIAWPTATNFSSTSYRYVAGTDYDRWNGGSENVDGEGDGFTLMGKRTTTFLSRGKVMVESSPGRPLVDPTWQPATAHEAPPVGTKETGGGILGIYNRSDRRRWYWKCPHCAEWFQAEPGLGLFKLPDDDELVEAIRDIDLDAFARQYARVICPVGGCVIAPAEREGMNRAARWLRDGLSLDHLDRLSGNPRTSTIAGFWLGGVAATYVKWETLVSKHLSALLDYALTGSELSLQTTANTDQSVPYMSRHLLEAARNATAGSRYERDLPRYIVPDWGRFLVAAVDVQGGKRARFEVQVHAIGEHQEQSLVDRYSIKWSKRPGVGDEFAPIDPAAYPEDWDLLTEKVLTATYRTGDPAREMRVKVAAVDSGGEDGVTNNCYAWARRVRKAGLSQRLRITKGASTRADWHIRETQVGGRQGKGDVTLHLLEPNKFKDMVFAGLQRRTPGPGYYHFPEPRSDRNPDGWLTAAFFDELRAEVRNESGVWEQVKKVNESFDLCYMIRAACMMLGADKREFWASPPPWARPHDINSEVVAPEQRRDEKAVAPAAALLRSTAAPRRVGRSSYLG